MDRLPATPTDFTLHLPAMDSELMPDWLYEPGPEIPLSQDDVRRLYRDQTDEDSLLSLGLSSIRAPSHAELQSLWDDSDSGSDDDGDDERLDDHDHDDDENAASSSDADTDSTSATLHDAHPPSPALKVPIAQPPLVLHPHSAESLWLYSYSAADPELETCLRCIEEELLCNPFSVYADVCYLATVKSEPQHGLLTRGSSELERVAEEDEEESDESEDEPEELHSPVQTGGGGKWSSGVCVGTSPESALSLPAAYIDSKPRCFSPEPAAAAEVAYLFLRTQYSVDPKESVGAFPTQIVRESSGRHSVKDLLRGFSLRRVPAA